MDELFKWLLAFVFSVYLLLFVFSNDPVPEALAHHWTHDCRLLEKNIDKGLLSPRKTGFSVVMLLKMSVQMSMKRR
jgi:hypothetical protein